MQNKTSLVTGASDGIGLECCKILAAKGSNLILVSRRQTLLDEIAASSEGAVSRDQLHGYSRRSRMPQAAQNTVSASSGAGLGSRFSNQ